MKVVVIVLVLMAALTQGFAEDVTKEAIAEAFNKNEIIPDVIDNPPGEFLTVKYGSDEVNLGNTFKPSQVKDKPTLSWKADPNKFYVLSMIDPDAPSRKTAFLREFSHWLIGNIPGDQLEKGELIASYRGSGPPAGTGLHRYIFLVFEQSEKLTFDEPKVTDDSPIPSRVKFSVRKFAEKYKLGQPIVGNFFQSEFDISTLEGNLEDEVKKVEERFKELKEKLNL